MKNLQAAIAPSFLRSALSISRCLAIALALCGARAGAQYPMNYPSGPLSTFYSSGYIRVPVPLARTGHSFLLKWRTTAGGAVTTVSVNGVGFITSGPVGAMGGDAATINAALQSFLVAHPTPPPTYTYNQGNYTYVPFSAYEWWLVDSTAGQESQLHNEPLGPSSSVLGDTWTQTSGVSNRYFAIHESGKNDSLIVRDGASYTTATAGPYTYATYANGTSGATVPLQWCVASGPGPANSAVAYIADLTTAHKAPAGATDARVAAAWTFDSDYSSYPLVSVQVTLETREAGHHFSVHGGVAGAAPVRIAATAVAGTGNATLDFPIGTGLQFWVTRDAEDGHPSQPIAPATGLWTASAGATFSALGRFPDPPNRTTVPVTFVVNADTRGTHDFSVRQPDGYVMAWFTPGFNMGSISSWDDQGVANPLSVALLPAQVDPTKGWWLRDETTGEDLPIGQTEVLDGWTPMHTEPPPTPVLTVQLPVWREAGYVNISPSPHEQNYGATLGEFPATAPSSATFPGVDGMANYTIASVTITIENHHPYNTGFNLNYGLTDETYSFQGANADLRHWFGLTAPLTLNISESRLDHTLILRHPNGDSYPVAQGQVQGASSTDGNGNPWFNSYGYFDATANHHPELPWYVEDTSVGERIGPFPTSAALIAWTALLTPTNLQSQCISPRTIRLKWDARADISPDGAFRIERRINTATDWEVVAIESVPPVVAGDSIMWLDRVEPSGTVCSYRVRYLLGNRVSAYSNTTTATAGDIGVDSDGDGVPDAIEIEIGTDPDVADSDGDGISDGEEIDLGWDPTDPDEDGNGNADGTDDWDGDGTANAAEGGAGGDGDGGNANEAGGDNTPDLIGAPASPTGLQVVIEDAGDSYQYFLDWRYPLAASATFFEIGMKQRGWEVKAGSGITPPYSLIGTTGTHSIYRWGPFDIMGKAPPGDPQPRWDYPLTWFYVRAVNEVVNATDEYRVSTASSAISTISGATVQFTWSVEGDPNVHTSQTTSRFGGSVPLPHPNASVSVFNGVGYKQVGSEVFIRPSHIRVRLVSGTDPETPGGGDLETLLLPLVRTNAVLKLQVTDQFGNIAELPANKVVWEYRRLIYDTAGTGTPMWTEWASIAELQGSGTLPSSGNEITVPMTSGGIFQVRAAFFPDPLPPVGSPPDFGGLIYERSVDGLFYDPPATIGPLTRGNTNGGSGDAGSPQCIGVCDTHFQFALVHEARRWLGAVDYKTAVAYPNPSLGLNEEVGKDKPKCNVFVAHRIKRAGGRVSWVGGRGGSLTNGLIRPNPPTANQWAGAQRTHTLSLGLAAFTLDPWTLPFASSPTTYTAGSTVTVAGKHPQPGFVMSRPKPDGNGHVGVVDYDGWPIAAGSKNVNKKNGGRYSTEQNPDEGFDYYDRNSRYRMFAPWPP